MKQYVLRYKKNLILSVVFGILEVLFIYLFTMKSTTLVNIFTGQDVGGVNSIIFLAIIYIVLACLSYYISEKNSKLFSKNISLDLRRDYMDGLYLANTSSFYKSNKGEFLAEVDQNVDQLRLDYLLKLPKSITGIGTTIVYIVGLYKIHPYILLTTLAFVFLPGFVSSTFSKFISKLQVTMSKKYATYIDTLNELLDGYLVIKESNNRSYFLNKFDKDDDNLLSARNKYNISNSMLYEVMFALNLLSYLLIIYIGSLLVKGGFIYLSDLMASLSLVSISTNGISEAFRDFTSILSTKKIKEMVIEKIPNHSKEDIIREYPSLDIKIKNLSFAYGDNKIFDSLNLDIKENKLYGVIGKSGSGKSTLAKILMRINDNYEGDIIFANGNFEDFNEKEIYSLIYYLPQNSIVFRDDLIANITMGHRDVDLDVVKEIINKVDLNNVYESKKDSILDNDSLSGGEKKKLELARALYKKAKLIIFDEPTSGLDPRSAATIESLIRNLKDLTRIVITHNQDPEYLETFDEILNIEDYK